MPGTVNQVAALTITAILVIKSDSATIMMVKVMTVVGTENEPECIVAIGLREHHLSSLFHWNYMFPKPPPKDTAHTEFKLKVDSTFGGAAPGAGFSNDPHNAEFGFFVLSSPEELQVSLDKCDGSHWEVFDCFESVSEEEQTVCMICDDFSPKAIVTKFILATERSVLLWRCSMGVGLEGMLL